MNDMLCHKTENNLFKKIIQEEFFYVKYNQKFSSKIYYYENRRKNQRVET